MKLTLIGHLCFDVFHEKDGAEHTEIGGIYHAVAAMSYLAADKDTIIPVFGVGSKEYDDVVKQFGSLKNVNTAGIFSFDGETNHVHYFADGSNECSASIAAPIPFHRIKPFLNVDGIYINMISGHDISIDTLDEIRLDVRPKKIPIHLDIHCRTLQVEADGTRSRRPMSEWRRWCFMIDTVQMNEEEARGISIEKFSDELLAKQMIPLMVKNFIITRGEKGASLYKADHKHVIQKEIDAELVEHPVSVLASGDIFGAAYHFSYVKKENSDHSAQFAVKAASLATRYSVSDKHQVLSTLREEV